MEVLCGKGNCKRRNKTGHVGEENSGQRTACAKVLMWECVCFRNIKEASAWSEWNEKVSYRT